MIGGSAGSAVFAALQVARELDETKTIVVLLPDTGRQYLSKVYSDSWMLQHGMLDRPDVIRVEEVLRAKHGELPPLITVGAHDKVRQAVERLQEPYLAGARRARGEHGRLAVRRVHPRSASCSIGTSETRTRGRPTSPRLSRRPPR